VWEGYVRSVGEVVEKTVERMREVAEESERIMKELRERVGLLEGENSRMTERLRELEGEIDYQKRVVETTVKILDGKMKEKTKVAEELEFLRKRIFKVFPNVDLLIENPEFLYRLDRNKEKSKFFMPYFEAEQFMNNKEKNIMNDLFKIMDCMHVKIDFYSKFYLNLQPINISMTMIN
jgi:uncharacterized coiled-coil protein SlyX